MGAQLHGRQGGRLLPLCLLPGSGTLIAGRHELAVASAQVKSALLLAALRADGETTLTGRLDSRNHTELLFDALGVAVTAGRGTLVVSPPERIDAFCLTIPGDVSSASFFLAGALITRRRLAVEGCGLNPTRLGFLSVLRRMGAAIEERVEAVECGEPVGSLRVRPADLTATTVRAEEIPSLIDEIPLLAVVALFARGTTVVEGAEELRHKESDRLAAVGRLVAAVGGRIDLRRDGFAVEGPQTPTPGTVDPEGDHRLAMAAAVLGAGVAGGVSVLGFEAAQVSYPDFVKDYQTLGGVVR
jgi:3-phosphoshikimate 1-carboxyvinyltransferase